MNGPSPLRCFWTICRPPAAAWLAAASLFAWGAHVAAKRPKDIDEIVALAMLGQMLAASTGFHDRLIRGHFDPVLAGRRSRVPVAIAHAAVSIAPGLIVWLLVGALEWSTHARRVVTFSPGGLMAIAHVSVTVWAISLALGKNTGGVLWVFTLFVLAGAHRLSALQEAYGTSSASLGVSAAAARAALVFPGALLTNGGYVEPAVITMVVAAVAAIFTGGVAMIVWMDAPLKDPS